VLEARQRLGGRIWTHQAWGFPVELGASWIHGSQGNPLTSLARQYNQPFVNSRPDRSLVLDANGLPLSQPAEAHLDRAMEQVEAFVRQHQRIKMADQSVFQVLQRYLSNPKITSIQRQAAAMWAAATTVNTGADLSRLSLRYFDSDDAFAGPDVMLVNGYSQLVSRLAQGLTIQLGQVVKHIHVSPEGVSVETDPREAHQPDIWRGDAVVVTLPLGVLKARRVLFEPALPRSKTGAIQRLGVGLLNKVALRYSRIDWPRWPEFVEWVPEGPEPTGITEVWNGAAALGQPTLVAMAGGAFARKLEGMGNDQILERLSGQLRSAFEPSLPSAEAVLVTRWQADPYARGAYVYLPVGATPADYDRLAAPVGNRLFFAGEATHRHYPGTVHGAYLSGIREAQRILQLF
jgi:monoamine oxidase